MAIAALAHHYEARSIDVSDVGDGNGDGDGDNISLGTKKSQTVSSNESFIGNAREALRAHEAAAAAAAAASSECDEESVSAVAIKRTHLKEALASHEETQRLQRMCRYLKVRHTPRPWHTPLNIVYNLSFHLAEQDITDAGHQGGALQDPG